MSNISSHLSSEPLTFTKDIEWFLQPFAISILAFTITNIVQFVRKEYELADATYENEIRILSTLQLLKTPNILQIVGCYTYKSKHNLISPYIAGGTLRHFLKNQRPEGLSHERIIYSLSGLACGIWALHELILDSNETSHKGHHQDLRLDNVLVERDRFILADLGLSSIRDIGESSLTPFKGRRGYCQAPECVDLGHPYRERDLTRATDIFSLGCIAADVIVYLVRGPSGVKKVPRCSRIQYTFDVLLAIS
jgi:serine/threonine protein kinase